MSHLMNLLPALEVLGPDDPVVVQEGLRHHGVGGVDDRVVQGGQALAVPVIG